MMRIILPILIVLCLVSSTKAEEVGSSTGRGNISFQPVICNPNPRYNSGTQPVTYLKMDDLKRVSGIIERIEVQGSTKIREGFIRREITLKPGEKFDLKQAMESKNNILRNLQYIEAVNLYIEPGSEKGKLIVIFEIHEAKAKLLTLSAGYNDEEKFFGFCQLWYENFLHRGMFLGVDLKKGDNVNCSSLTIYEPWLFHTPHSFEFKIYSDKYKRTELPYQDKGTYWIDRDGYLLEFGKRDIMERSYLFEKTNLCLKYRHENVTLSDLKDVSPAITPPQADINSLIGQMEIDTRRFQSLEAEYELPFEDKYPSALQLNPVSGERLDFLVEVVNDSLGADYNFNKYRLNLNKYLKLSDRQVLALSSKTGYIAGDAPFYEGFYVGGGDTIRGYKERGLTNTGGNKLLVLTTEYRLGLTKSVQGVLFADAGYAWEKGTKIRLDDLEYGVGTGFRIYHSLIGGINISFGYGIGKKDWEIHITGANTGE